VVWQKREYETLPKPVVQNEQKCTWHNEDKAHSAGWNARKISDSLIYHSTEDGTKLN
jgi:hypothetical protein